MGPVPCRNVIIPCVALLILSDFFCTVIMSSLCDCVIVCCFIHSWVNPIYFSFSVVQLVAGVAQSLK